MTTDEMSAVLEQMGRKAKQAAETLAVLSDEVKKAGLNKMADALIANESRIIEANSKDLENARENGLSNAMIDRLTLNSSRIAAMADGLRTVAEQTDPVGKVLENRTPTAIFPTTLSSLTGVEIAMDASLTRTKTEQNRTH